MLVSDGSRRQTVTVAVAALVGLAGVVNGTVGLEAEDTDAFIERVIAETARAGVSVRATRHLEAGTISGKYRAWMEVETNLAASGAFSWRVLNEGGSERTREKVFRAVLDAESRDKDAQALTLANYVFSPLASAAGTVKLRLTPRRTDAQLIDGTLTVGADGHPLMLEGKLAKSPSFWTKSVTVVKRYSRVAGVSLPSSIESLAELRMFGRSSFAMRYSYATVNGRSVGTRASATPSFGPSPEILALHAQLHEGQ
jgi:hypothetical protein